MKKGLLPLLMLGWCSCGPHTPPYAEKHLIFPAGSTPEEKIEMAAYLVPTPEQIAWQKLELTAFLHFGINTFTDREWGDGTEDPALFNPVDFDADQWVRTLQNAGFRMVILTAKHHDGFCLWPTKTTDYSVASALWRNGRGDVVRELREACDRHGMKFGVYLSPWDRHAPCYGDSPAYNRYFIEQLTELLTDYGTVHEVWFDGACGEGPDGRRQVYDWDAVLATIHRLQPQAVTAIMGDDIRWVGNERGVGRETEWSATPLVPGGYTRAEAENKALGINGTAKDLGSREIIAQATEMFWYPSEVDVSIRPGWFHHASEDAKVKTLSQLAEIYFASVGRNSVLLLNVPPDYRGRIHAADSVRLCEFARYLAESFADDRVAAGEALWEGTAGEACEYALKPQSRINAVLLQEDIAYGQRVEGFTVEVLTPDGWTTAATGTTIGYKRIVRFPEVEAAALRLRLTGTRTRARIVRVGAYAIRLLEATGTASFTNDLPRDTWTICAASPLTIDFGKEIRIAAFTYAPYHAEARPDMAYRYTLAASTDGTTWTPLVEQGEFGNIMHNPTAQTVQLAKPVAIRYLRLEGSSPDGGAARILPEELGITMETK